MSWFKHKPRPKTPPKQHPHHSSPISERIFEEIKEKQRNIIPKPK